MMRTGSLLVLLLLLASCAPSPTQRVARADDLLHYQVLASIAPGGELTADVTITLPPGTFREGDFILGRRFALQPIETSPRADVRVEPTDEPLDGLHGIHVRFEGEQTRPMSVRFRYSGPIFANEKQDRLGYTPDAIEMALELMWLPYVSQLNRRFTVDAELRGIAPDMVVVAQGDVRHDGDRVHIHRSAGDFDFAWVAVRGLQVVQEPGIEFYARDLNDPLAQILRKHALAAAHFYRQWFGPLPAGRFVSRSSRVASVVPMRGAATQSSPTGASRASRRRRSRSWAGPPRSRTSSLTPGSHPRIPSAKTIGSPNQLRSTPPGVTSKRRSAPRSCTPICKRRATASRMRGRCSGTDDKPPGAIHQSSAAAEGSRAAYRSRATRQRARGAESQPAAQDAGIPGCSARCFGEQVAADFEAALRAS